MRRLNILVLFISAIFVYILTFRPFPALAALNDCVCETVTDASGNKSCVLRAGSSCATGKQAYCISNPDGGCNHASLSAGSCICQDPGFVVSTSEDKNFCTQQGHGSGTNDPWISTALGCIPVKIDSLVVWLLPKLLSVTGGIAFLLMVSGFISMAMSGGDPKALQAAQEKVSSAITGLLVSIFGLFILRLIVVGILKIPGIN